MAFKDSQESRLYVGIYDITQYVVEVSGIPGERPLLDATTLNDAGRKFVPTIQNAEGSFSGLFEDTATTGLDAVVTVLRADTDGEIITYWPANSGRRSSNDYREGYGIEAAMVRDVSYTSRIGSLTAVTVPFVANGDAEVLHSLVPIDDGFDTYTVTGQPAYQDDGAGTTAGGSWYYQVSALTATGGNAQWILTLQDSSDTAAWATVDTVTLSATGSARREFTGNLDQYVRLLRTLDATTGSITLHSSYYRG